jgi:hypothetical protein
VINVPVRLLRGVGIFLSAQIGRLTAPRRSNPLGTDRCACGHAVVAPLGSSYSADVVTNEWHCSACGREWKTFADSPNPEGSLT